jgi:hypothetical protein
MTTPAPKKTSLTDLDNVMWVIERPPPGATAENETVASAGRGPRMTAYSTLLAAVAGDPDFAEGKVKRDSKGRFAKKAGVKATASAPPTPSPQLRMSQTVMDAYLVSQDPPSGPGEADKAFDAFSDARTAYESQYGPWSPNAHQQQEDAFEQELAAWNASPPTPSPAGTAKKTAKKTTAKKAAPASSPAPAASGGKKMTNKVIYAKHPNGTIINSTDGQHRMVFNAAGNNWTVQRRTPDGGWEVIDVLGKGAAYKKANELSALWDDPHDGTAEELTPAAPAVDPTGPFAPGWNDLSGAGIGDFKKMQILTTANTQIPNPETMDPGLIMQHIANIAQTYNVAPEHVVALMDEQRGDTLVSETMQEKLAGGPFPPSIYPSAAAVKKAAATAKKAAAAVTPPAPTVAPSPSAPIIKKVAKKAAPVNYSTANAPATKALNGEPHSVLELAKQSNASAKLSKLHSEMLEAYSNGDEALGDELAEEFDILAHNYKQKYGNQWTPKHGAKVAEAFEKSTTPTPTPASPAPTASVPTAASSTTLPGAKPGVGADAKVKLANGDVGTVLGSSTTSDGSPGVLVFLPSGTAVVVPIGEPTVVSDTAAGEMLSAPPVGSTVNIPAQGEFTIVGGLKVGGSGALYAKTMSPAGKIVWKKVSDLNKALGAPAPATSTTPTPAAAAPLPAPLKKGATVMTPGGEGVVNTAAPGSDYVMVTFPSTGTMSTYHVSDVSEITPPPTPTASTPHAPGTKVNTMYGVGTVVASLPDGKYSIMTPTGSTVTLPDGDISAITPATPPMTAPPPPPPSAMTYDANGVPVLTPAQQHSLTVQFQGSGVNWYNSSEAIFDAAYAASQATGMSIEDVLKYADANFHKSKKDGGKPMQAKISKWAKSSKGKAHMQATMGSAAAAPISASPPPAPAHAATSADDISNVPALKKTQALTQFTSGFVSLNDTPQSLAQKASDVANNLGLTPAQVLKIVDEKKAQQAGVPNGNLFENKVMGHLAGKPFPPPAAATPSTPSSGGTSIPLAGTSTSYAAMSAPFPPSPDFPLVSTSEATQLQASMEATTPPPWTATQRSAIVSYTGAGYQDMNKCLRFGTNCTPSVQGRIKNASAAMRPTTQPITTFRGTNLAMFGVSNIAELEAMQGDVVYDPGFSSTSINPNSAFGGAVAMQIEIPAGSPGAYVANVSNYPNEQEFLLPPGTRFRIIEVSLEPGSSQARVRVEVVPA